MEQSGGGQAEDGYPSNLDCRHARQMEAQTAQRRAGLGDTVREMASLLKASDQDGANNLDMGRQLRGQMDQTGTGRVGRGAEPSSANRRAHPGDTLREELASMRLACTTDKGREVGLGAGDVDSRTERQLMSTQRLS
mmetsp:Transcript_48734/g.109427  ORF Transcript_48734/g.109427 Transcript_48734/m.109427 type:complete len:137 (+) Transcript_48734:83-493(+)